MPRVGTPRTTNEVKVGICASCGEKLTYQGSAPSAPGGRIHEHVWKCENCQRIVYRDAHLYFHHNHNPLEGNCCLCGSANIGQKFGGAAPWQYLDGSWPKIDAPNRRLKNDYVYCFECAAEYVIERCPFCNSANTRTDGKRINQEGGRDYWHYNYRFDCADCGQGWLYAGGGSD